MSDFRNHLPFSLLV